MIDRLEIQTFLRSLPELQAVLGSGASQALLDAKDGDYQIALKVREETWLVFEVNSSTPVFMLIFKITAHLEESTVNFENLLRSPFEVVLFRQPSK